VLLGWSEREKIEAASRGQWSKNQPGRSELTSLNDSRGMHNGDKVVCNSAFCITFLSFPHPARNRAVSLKSSGQALPASSLILPLSRLSILLLTSADSS
jgi:hypothetical protein